MSDHTDDPIDERLRPSRRRLLQAAAAAGAFAGAPIATAQGQGEIELGGHSAGWEGRAPAEIEGETNPPLTLQEGETHVIVWENVDGQPHNVVIEDDEGNELVASEVISERGATQEVEFEATAEMAEYYCEVHPTSMRGQINIGGAQSQQEGAEPAAATEGFFEEGASVGLQQVAEGMTAPTDMATAGEDDDRLFVTDQTGQLYVVDQEEGRDDEPFLDVEDLMVGISEEFNGSYADPESDYDERGLLGVEFHPDFPDEQRVFVNYSAPPDDETPEGWSHVQVIAEFEVDDDGESADPDSERRIMEFQSPQYNHNSGPIAFGPDGYLYVPMGDGGGANDEMYGHVDDWYDDNAGGNGQDTTESLLGGVHRIDVDGETEEDGDGEAEDRAYDVPEDNPLVDDDEGLDEYYAWGFRNPFGIDFDSDGRLFVSDAGQALYEEANVVEAGGNYGWNVKEGTHCFSTDNPGDPPEDCPDSTPEDVRGGEELLDPIVEYPHTYEEQSVGITIIGGHVYEGEALPDLEGAYVFGDWTRDVARQDPMGRVFVARDPEADTGATGDGTTEDGAGQAGNETGQTDGGTDGLQNGTGDDGNATGTEGGVTGGQAGNETAADGNETETQDGNLTAGTDDGNETAMGEEDGTGEGDVQDVPTDELWEMEELVFEGGEDGNLNRFVRQFGQDDEGEVYVLTNTVGVPQGDTGEVLKLVPPEEGEDLEPPEADEEEEDGEDAETQDETEDEAVDGNETADGNATGTEGGVTGGQAGNETAADGNETGN